MKKNAGSADRVNQVLGIILGAAGLGMGIYAMEELFATPGTFLVLVGCPGQRVSQC